MRVYSCMDIKVIVCEKKSMICLSEETVCLVSIINLDIPFICGLATCII